MSAISTDMAAKRDIVIARLEQLLRLVMITGSAMLAMVVFHLPTGQPATGTSHGVVLLMLVALFAASTLIAFHFSFWYLAPPLNAAALFLSPVGLEHDIGGWLFAAVLIATLLFLGAVCLHVDAQQEKWWQEAGWPYEPFRPFLENPVRPEQQPFRITPLSKTERWVIVHPAHASIFELMNAAQKAWTWEDVDRLEQEIMKRGAWGLYTQLEGRPYRRTAAGPLDTRNRPTRWAHERLEAWLEWRDQDHVSRSAFLHVTVSFLNLLAMALPVTSFMVLTLGSVAASRSGASATAVIFSFWLLIAATVLVVWLRSLLSAVLMRHETDE